MIRDDDFIRKVKELRSNTDMGLCDSKAHVMREELLEDIGAAQSIDDIKAILARVVSGKRHPDYQVPA